ncbi:MAG TPA: hypothetical protein VIM48_05725 [Chthoniobacterales bacterium]
MKLFPWWALALGLCMSAWGTTLKPLSTDDQIRDAAMIFRGRVQSVDAARKATGQGSIIVSTVQFIPLAIYKGDVPAVIKLEFPGGKIGDVEMKVAGIPEFQVGQEYVLFVSGDQSRVCPVVGWSEGSLKVDRDASAAGKVDVSTTAGGVLGSPDARTRASGPRSVDLSDFESRLRARIDQVSKSSK